MVIKATILKKVLMYFPTSQHSIYFKSFDFKVIITNITIAIFTIIKLFIILMDFIKVIINAKFTFIKNVTNGLLTKIKFILLSKHFIIAMLNPFNFNDHKMLKIYLIIIIDVSITIIDKTINIIY
jgi:hypothetical protein